MRRGGVVRRWRPSRAPSTRLPPAAGRQDDLDCNGTIDGRDALRPIRAAAGVPIGQPGDCPRLDFGSPEFADVNCDGSVGPPDTVAILQFAGGVSIDPAQPSGCTPIGQALP